MSRRPFPYWLATLLPLSAACQSTLGSEDGTREPARPSALPTATPLGVVSQFRYEPTHRGVAPAGSRLDGPPSLVWVAGPFAIGTYDASKSSPAVGEDSVYVGEDDGLLRALDRETGQLRWSYATRRHAEESACSDETCTGIHGSPAYDERQVYIGDYAGWLYAIDRTNGSLVWERQLGGSIGSSPVLDGGRLWIAVESPEPNGQVVLLDAMTGNVLAASPNLGHHVHGTVSLAPSLDRLVTGTNAGMLYTLSSSTLQVASMLAFGAAIKSTAAVDAEHAYVTAWDGALHAVDLATGQAVYAVSTAKPSLSSPALLDELVCFGSHDAQLHCVDRLTGTPRWTALAGGYVQSSPTIVAQSRLVLVGAADGHLYAFNLDDGSLAFSYEIGEKITSVPVVVDSSIFVNDDSGRVHRLDCGPK